MRDRPLHHFRHVATDAHRTGRSRLVVMMRGNIIFPGSMLMARSAGLVADCGVVTGVAATTGSADTEADGPEVVITG